MNDPGVTADYIPLDTNMEFEDLTLPRDKFSRSRYFFVVHPRFTFFLLLDLTIIAICPIWFKLREASVLSICFFVFAIIIITTILPLAGAADDNANNVSDTRSSISFLGEVVKFRPGLYDNKWDLIAARLNTVFHHNNNNVTPYFFYDGADCLSCFKRWYVEPAQDRAATRSETENIGILPIIDKALKVYTDSVDEYWGEYMAEINGVSERNNLRNDPGKDQTAS